MRSVMQKALMVLCLAGSTASVRADADSIDLENQTYTPMRYRVRAPEGSFSDWRKILPRTTSQYSDHAILIIEIWYDKDRSEEFKLLRGRTYGYYRSKPGAAPEFAVCNVASPTVPDPPGAPAVKAASAEAAFAPLTQFIAQCQKLKHPYRLSLKKLAADCAQAQKEGGKLPPELRYVRGFTWFVGYLVDEANRDVVLLGIKDPTRPPLDIDCLATAIQAAHSDSVPMCSLEVHPDPAFQKSIVAGVPWKTRWAEVMIYADYDMKRLSQGLWDPKIKGFKSQQQHFEEVIAARGLEFEGQFSKRGTEANYLNRWWFNFNSKVPRAVSDDSGKLLYLYRNPARISTEQQIHGAFGSGETTVSARLFAKGFSEHIEELGQHYPHIAELQGLYRIYDLMRHLREVSQTPPPALEYWAKEYKHPYDGPPAKMPTLTVARDVRVRTGSGHHTQKWTVKGGVVMRVAITPESLQRTGTTKK